MKQLIAQSAAALLLSLICLPARAEEQIEEIIVTADFRGRLARELPASVSIFDAGQLDKLAVQHFEELVGIVPNLNWSGDGHRARYFQIRGVGELEQYEGAPNPSVGFLIDDIDFSGIGTVATLFDIERAEVLRGPQGTRYGANALAGLIYLQSTEPTAQRNGRVEVDAGSDQLFSAGIAFGGSLNAADTALYRVSAHHFRSDGFRDNPWLDRTDTNARDETTFRARLAIDPSDTLAIRVAAFYADIDNGYDAFALDDSYTVMSDKPGRDAQRSLGASVDLTWSPSEHTRLRSISSLADSDIDFSFDADWGNPASWAPVTYDYVTLTERKRRTFSQELRLESASGPLAWLAGLYAQRLEDELDARNLGDYYDPFYDFAATLDDRLQSDYTSLSAAAFGQLEWALDDVTRLTIGLRVERRSVEYSDSNGLVEDPDETLAGGEISITRDHGEQFSSYVALSRGYKAGGFNLGFVPEGRREFSGEAMWNLEAGIRSFWLERSLRFNLSVFYSERRDQQVRTSFQADPGDPASFVFFTDNAAEGETVGLEADVRWFAGEQWEFYATLGLLDASFSEFVTPQVDLTGRDQAHAPGYTFAGGAAWRHPGGWFARADVSGKDAFYFDVSHDQESEAYALVNLRAGYDTGTWSAELWARNIFARRYAVRGFYFGNQPPDFPTTLYTRAGDPRQFGVRYTRSF